MASEAEKVPDVIEAIGRMTEELAKIGISKDKKNADQKYNFRGIDDIRNAIAPLQKDCGLLIVPRLMKREQIERTTKNGGFALQVIVSMEFDFISRKDGSKLTVPAVNEAVDYSDKATNKAISQAYKTVCINVFNIPTEGEDDTDEEKKELKGKRVGVFDTPELRQTYIENCVKAFTDVPNTLRLKEVETVYHERLILMSNSEDPADRDGAMRLRETYANRNAVLVDAEKPKTRIVENMAGRV